MTSIRQIIRTRQQPGETMPNDYESLDDRVLQQGIRAEQEMLTRRRAPPSQYASRDPAQIASVMIQSVSKVGDLAATEIEQTADDLVRGANEIADELRKLAATMRGYAHEHAAKVTEFCERATGVFAGAQDLQEKLFGGPKPAAAPEGGDDGAPIPTFLARHADDPQ